MAYMAKLKSESSFEDDTPTDIFEAIKTDCWRTSKFVTGPETNRHYCKLVCQAMEWTDYLAPTDEGKALFDQFVTVYGPVVTAKVSSHRSNTQSTMKTTMDKLKKCLDRDIDMTNPDDYGLFKWYWTQYIPATT